MMLEVVDIAKQPRKKDKVTIQAVCPAHASLLEQHGAIFVRPFKNCKYYCKKMQSSAFHKLPVPSKGNIKRQKHRFKRVKITAPVSIHIHVFMLSANLAFETSDLVPKTARPHPPKWIHTIGCPKHLSLTKCHLHFGCLSTASTRYILCAGVVCQNNSSQWERFSIFNHHIASCQADDFTKWPVSSAVVARCKNLGGEATYPSKLSSKSFFVAPTPTLIRKVVW